MGNTIKSIEQRRFPQKELSRNNGIAGTPAFIAYQRVVYDVSRSFLWQNGKHQAIHAAGNDLTRELDQAPHYADLLKRFPIVGVLI